MKKNAITNAVRDTADQVVDDVQHGYKNIKSKFKGNGFGKRDHVNVGPIEREVSIVAGLALAISGMRHPISVRGLGMLGLGAGLIHRGWTGKCKMYKAMGMKHVADESQDASAKPEEYYKRATHVEHSVTIAKPAEELFKFWRNLENLPQFMSHLRDVKTLDSKRSHWVAKAPLGGSVHWDAEVINEEANRLIAWQSIGSPDVDNAGSVRFYPSGDGKSTNVQVTIDYIPPIGHVGAWIAKALGEDPKTQIVEDLRKLKEMMEGKSEDSTGEAELPVAGRLAEQSR